MKTKFFIKGIQEIKVITEAYLSSDGVTTSEEWISAIVDIDNGYGYKTEIEAIEALKELMADTDFKKYSECSRFEISKGYTFN